MLAAGWLVNGVGVLCRDIVDVMKDSSIRKTSVCATVVLASHHKSSLCVPSLVFKKTGGIISVQP